MKIKELFEAKELSPEMRLRKMIDGLRLNHFLLKLGNGPWLPSKDGTIAVTCDFTPFKRPRLDVSVLHPDDDVANDLKKNSAPEPDEAVDMQRVIEAMKRFGAVKVGANSVADRDIQGGKARKYTYEPIDSFVVERQHWDRLFSELRFVFPATVFAKAPTAKANVKVEFMEKAAEILSPYFEKSTSSTFLVAKKGAVAMEKEFPKEFEKIVTDLREKDIKEFEGYAKLPHNADRKDKYTLEKFEEQWKRFGVVAARAKATKILFKKKRADKYKQLLDLVKSTSETGGINVIHDDQEHHTALSFEFKAKK